MKDPVQHSTTRRITEFEGLRAILCWYVVIGHILQYSGFSDPSTIPFYLSFFLRGDLAVDVFIILSGFVIFLLLDGGKPKTYSTYIGGRFFRIYPVYLITIVAAAILLPLKLEVFEQAAWANEAFADKMLVQGGNTYSYFISHSLAHLSVLHGMLPDQVLPDSSIAFLSPAWSLSLEWQFYIIAPLALLCIKRSVSVSLVGALVILAAGRFIPHTYDLSFGYGAFLPLKFEFFIVGIASYFFYKFLQIRQKLTSRNVFLIVLSSTIFSLFCFFGPFSFLATKAVPLTVWMVVLLTAITRELQFDCQPLELVSNTLNSQWLQTLGKVSYSTYLVHVIVLWPMMWCLLKLSPQISPSLVLVTLLSVGSIMIVVISCAMFDYIERPFMKLGKRLLG